MHYLPMNGPDDDPTTFLAACILLARRLAEVTLTEHPDQCVADNFAPTSTLTVDLKMSPAFRQVDRLLAGRRPAPIRSCRRSERPIPARPLAVVLGLDPNFGPPSVQSSEADNTLP